MKKILLFFYLLAFVPLQAQVLFQEDFDGIAGPTAGGAGTYTFPSGWLRNNVDNRTPDAQVAYVNEAWERREDFNFSVIDSCAFSTSYYSPVGAADDWMWTPPIVLPATTTDIQFGWNAVTYDGAFQDGYEVRVMASPNIPTGGTGVLGNQVTASTLLVSIPAENSAWTARTTPLNAYNGQTVRIAFRNNSNDKFLLLIDDVTVTVMNPMAELQEVAVSEYTRIPRNQYEPPTFSAKIKNVSIPAFTASVRLRIYDPSMAIVTTALSPPVLLVANQVSDMLSAPTAFQPAGTGTYTFRYDIVVDGTGEVISTQEVNHEILFTDTEMARDDDAATGSLGIGAGNGGYLGQSFEITNDITLRSVDIFSTGNGDTVDVEMGCAVFKLVSGVPQLLFTAPSQQIAVGATAAWLQYTVDPPLDLLAGDVIVVCAQEYAQTISVGLTNTQFTAGSTYVDWPTSPFPDWAHNEDFGGGFAKSYMIRPHLSCLMENPIVTAPQEFCDTATVADLFALGDNIQWFQDAEGGSALTANTVLVSGTHYVTQSLGFCSSLRVPVEILITPSTTNTTTVTGCDSYSWPVTSQVFTESGTYSSTNGCHTEILELTITPNTSNTTTIHACDGYSWPVNGMEYTEAGTYTYVENCHTEILELTFTTSTSNATAVSACGSYTWDVNGQEYTSSGTYSVTDNCHTEILELTVTPNTTNTTTIHACDGYTWPVNGMEYTEAGTYAYLENCHTEILELTFTTSTSNTTAVSACDSYVWDVNGQEYTSSGTYSVTDNCHTEIVELTITPSTANSTTLTTCGSYIWPVNGQEYTSTGIYEYVVGCHTETLGLTVNPGPVNETIVFTCDSYTWFANGEEYILSGTYTYMNGCDNEVLVLNITNSAIIDIQPEDQVIEEGTSVAFTVMTAYAVSWQWQSSTDNGANWNDIIEGGGFTGTESSTLTIAAATATMALNGLLVRVIAGSGSDCPDVTTNPAMLTILLNTTAFDLNNLRLYPNPTASHVNIELKGLGSAALEIFDMNGRQIKSQLLQDGVTPVDISNVAAGVYLFRITTANGIVNKSVIRN